VLFRSHVMLNCASNISTVLVCFFCQDPEEGNAEDMVAWLNVHHQPQSKLLEYWRKTAKLRLNYIHGASAPGINDVCIT